MTLPIVLYGDAVLRKKSEEITPKYEGLKQLIKDMFETKEVASGVGLAAPQIGKSIRLFIVDTEPFAQEGEDDYELLKNFKETFINPEIISEQGKEWGYEEGCLSIPDVRANVNRKEEVTISYFDENFNKKTETYNGIIARVIQHEYDHIEGVLFIDKISSFKRNMIKGKLNKIKNNKLKPNYKTKNVR